MPIYLDELLVKLEEEEPESKSAYKRPTFASHYNQPYVDFTPAEKAAAAANRPLPKYGPNMKIHEKDSRYEGEQDNGVKYTSMHERVFNYKVSITGQMTRGLTGELLDTAAVKEKAKQEGADLGAANIVQGDGPLSPQLQALLKEWTERAIIWVCVPIDLNDPRQSVFYSHVCRPGAFHHSSLGAGREVLGAGEWIVEAGKLKKISANSGHYQPSLTSLHQSVLALTPALQPDTTVLLWNKKAKEWQDVPVNGFIKDPTGSGTYKSHWRAPD